MARTIMKLKQISEKTGIPLATLRFYRHRGLGPKTWVLAGRVVAFEDDVDAWIDAQRDAEPRGIDPVIDTPSMEPARRVSSGGSVSADLRSLNQPSTHQAAATGDDAA